MATEPKPSKVKILSGSAVLTTHEVAKLLQVNNSSVSHWTREKGLNCYRTPGNHRRILVADLASFLATWKMPQPFVLSKE